MLARCMLPMGLRDKSLAPSRHARERDQSQQEKALWSQWPSHGKGGERWIGG